MQTNRNIIANTFIVLAAISTFLYLHSNSNNKEIIVDQLDLTCGFTDDFTAFLNSNSKDFLI